MSDMVNVDFVRQVKIMRRLQKEFFRLKPADRPPSLIREAKAAEKAVDDMIAEFQRGQGDLFGGGPNDR